MSHLSDKDIDHLAREAAEQLDVDQNSSGWEALQAKLDIEMPVEKRRRRWLLFLLFPLLGGVFFLAYKLNQSPNSESLTKQASSINNPGPNSKAATDNTITENSNSTENQGPDKSTIEPPSTKTADRQPVAETNETNPPLASEEQEQSSTIINEKNQRAQKPGSSSAKPPKGSGKKYTSPGNKQLIAKSASATAIVSQSGVNTPVKKSTADLTQNKQDIPANNTDNSSSPLTAVPSSDSISTSTTALDTQADSTLKTPAEAEALTDSALVSASSNKSAKKAGTTLMPEKGFVVGLIAGPDVSKVNGTSTDERGFNTGIVAGYRFNGRLSLISGINYTHKYYIAKGSDYKPAKGTWLDTVRLSKVVGDCFMYEIPVNIRYDVIASKKNYAFASAGLSSYFMQEENYDFHYTTNSGYYNSGYRSYKVSDQYWFSVLNISAGYERMLTKRLSLQVEPYIKLPLNGIGFGNMELSSYGVFFGIRYHAGTLKPR